MLFLRTLPITCRGGYYFLYLCSDALNVIKDLFVIFFCILFLLYFLRTYLFILKFYLFTSTIVYLCMMYVSAGEHVP